MPTATSPGNDLLIDFLAGDPVARDVLPERIQRFLLKQARRLGRDLPDDLQEEVAQQAFENLLRQSPKSFDPDRSSALGFIKLLVRNAVYQVRAMYAPPGKRTRLQRVDRLKEIVVFTAQPTTVQLEEVDPDSTASADDPAKGAELRHDAAVVLRLASIPVRTGLVRVHLQEHTLQEVATNLGIDRFKLGRQMMAFADEVRSLHPS
jgi:DNA-directed RNA polymerase specialized sigma24 family protein